MFCVQTIDIRNKVESQENYKHETNTTFLTVAKAALRRKKAFEHQLEQTSAQMMTVEREIGSIESANINKETLDAMKNASNAIKQIHGGLTVDQVDQTMEDLREQHAVGEEIAEALTQGAGTVGVDEDELDEELAELQQEQLDERMLKTGSVPVSDQIQRMPSAPSKCSAAIAVRRLSMDVLTIFCSKEHCIGRGGR
jgi:charged multivesicular body protein 4